MTNTESDDQFGFVTILQALIAFIAVKCAIEFRTNTDTELGCQTCLLDCLWCAKQRDWMAVAGTAPRRAGGRFAEGLSKRAEECEMQGIEV